ncbi:hypothetical protein GGI07_002290 [Coemansia sp. Benny D115]|nr:hypothetical protein GGI07_002290 [Coemansia sp. Benny D115]
MASSNQRSAAKYIVRPLIVGLTLPAQQSSAPAAASPSSGKDADGRKAGATASTRRTSLSQRLGLGGGNAAQHAKSAAKGAAADTNSNNSSGGEQTEQAEDAGKAKPKKGKKAAKIECSDIVDDNVYIGTSDGRVLHYIVGSVAVEASSEPERRLVRTADLQLGNKRVEQLVCLPAQDKLLVLCASTVVVYSLSELKPAAGPGFQPIRGVSCMALDERVPRAASSEATGVCVACLRAVQIYRLAAADMRLELEFQVSSSVGSVSYYGNYLCLADTETYKIVDLRKIRRGQADEAELPLMPTQQPQVDPESGRIVARPPRPHTLVAGPNEFMFLAASGIDAESSTLGVIVTAMGEARRGTLQFSAYPKSILYEDPFVVAVFASGAIEIHDTRNPEVTLVQTIELAADEGDARRPRRLCAVAAMSIETDAPRPEIIDTDITSIVGIASAIENKAEGDESGQGDKGQKEGATEIRREALEYSLPDSAQGKALSRSSRISILAASPDSLYCIGSEPPMMLVERLILEQQRIEEAMHIVDNTTRKSAAGKSGGVSFDTKTVEAQYLVQLAAMACLKSMLLDDALQYFRRSMIDPRALLHLFPELVQYLGPLLVPFARIPMASAVRALFCEIGDVYALVKHGAAQLLSTDSPEEQSMALAEALMANTLEVLERYFEFCHAQLQAAVSQNEELPFDADTVPVVDTVLARLYAVNGRHDKLCALLLSGDSSNVVGDLAAEFFLSTKRYYYYSLVYRAQGDVPRVLDIWHKLLLGASSNEGNDCQDNGGNGGSGVADGWTDDLFGGWSEYLQFVRLTDNQTLMLAEFGWAVGVNVAAALQLMDYLSDVSVAVLDADAAIAAIESDGDQSLRVFIERLIVAGHARATHYMTYLVKAYVRQIREFYLESGGDKLESLEMGFKRMQAENLGLSFRSYLSRVAGGDEGEAGGVGLRVRLLKILTTPPLRYSPAEVLECMEAKDTTTKEMFHVERAALMVALGRVDDAVDVLIYGAGDYAEAELLLLTPLAPSSLARLAPSPFVSSDGERSIKEEADSAADNVKRLFRMYLRVGDTDEEMSARLVADLLSRSAGILDTQVVLEEVPGHWPLTIVESFLCRGLERLGAEECRSQVLQGVFQSRSFGAKTDLMDAVRERGAVVLDYSQTCVACKKLLGSSAFVYEPGSGDIKHISCA